MSSQKVFRSNDAVYAAYHELQAGDCIVGRLRLRPSDEHIIADLLSRGVKLIPSGLAQLVCRSKTFQALLFARDFMAPGTCAIHDIHDLQQAMCAVGGEGAMITKLDRKNAGLGILRWASVEDVFNAAVLGSLPFPFVLQPFIPDCRDIRIILLGSFYQEAYERVNEENFRNNLHFGGQSKPCTLDKDMESFCRRVMARGRFDYAHLDLLVPPDGSFYLNEINLRGGLRGAAISPKEYREFVAKLHDMAVDA